MPPHNLGGKEQKADNLRRPWNSRLRWRSGTMILHFGCLPFVKDESGKDESGKDEFWYMFWTDQVPDCAAFQTIKK